MFRSRRLIFVATIFTLLTLVQIASAATHDWTFVKGFGVHFNDPAVYNDPNPANNHPGPRSSAAKWTDLEGNLWLFSGCSNPGGCTIRIDLWKYEPDTNIWTLVKGSMTDYGWGVHNDPDPTNSQPGARFDAVSWVDQAGNLWLFGGQGHAAPSNDGVLNDLWMYDPDTNIWTLINGSGDYVGEYGVYTDPTPANNHPGSRLGAVSWTDSAGNFWVFGGDGFAASGTVSPLNDLWKYDPETNIWTFVKGSSDYMDEFGVYNDPNPANNYPGSRYRASALTDTSGNLWLFGGLGYAASGSSGTLNDLWKYDPSTGNWTFVKGSGDYVGEIGVYNNPNPANNYPSSRYQSAAWSDLFGNLWMFGGIGFSTSQSLSGFLNDLWKFDPASGNWTFVKGSGDYVNEIGVYNNPNPANNYPGSRSAAVSWVESSGDLWLLGGTGFPASGSASYLNDLWKFQVSIFADVPVAGKAWMQEWVEALYLAGITGGCDTDPLIYCPEREVTRAEMAVFVVRTIHYPNLPYTPANQGGTFSDVPEPGKEWMEDWIEEFYDSGITGGCATSPSLWFCPERSVTRAEAAVFILRALEGGSYQPPAASGYFDDVPFTGKDWMEAWIDEFYRRGITTGCEANPLRYCPERPVTRAEMAVFILRAFESIPNP